VYSNTQFVVFQSNLDLAITRYLAPPTFTPDFVPVSREIKEGRRKNESNALFQAVLAHLRLCLAPLEHACSFT
jgi:hypothetical protein